MSMGENGIALEDVPDGAQEASCFEGPGAPDAGDWAAMAERLHPGASARPPLSRVPGRGYAHVKRALDVALSLAAIAALSPVLLACAVAVKATSPGPVLFRQERWGRAGTRFECWKFRTMLVEAPPDLPAKDFAGKAAFMTPVGPFLRKWSLDELPQLANILKGDIPSRILKTRRGFSLKTPGAFALPANVARTRIAASLQVKALVSAIAGVPQNLFRYFTAGHGATRGILQNPLLASVLTRLVRFLPVMRSGLPV